MTIDDVRKPEGALERSPKSGPPSGVDANRPKRFSVQPKMAIVALLLRGQPLESWWPGKRKCPSPGLPSGASARSQARLRPPSCANPRATASPNASYEP